MIRHLTDKKNEYENTIDYYGGIVDGKRSGFGVEYDYSDSIFIGTFKENEREGFGVHISHPYSYHDELGSWEAGEKSGLFIECGRYDNEGTRSTDMIGSVIGLTVGTYMNGRLQGKVVEYDGSTLWIKYQGSGEHIDLGVSASRLENKVLYVGQPIGGFAVDVKVEGEVEYTGQIAPSKSDDGKVYLTTQITKEQINGIGRMVSLQRSDELVFGSFSDGHLHGVCFLTEAYGFRLIGEWEYGVFKKGLLWDGDKTFSEVVGIDGTSDDGTLFASKWDGDKTCYELVVVDGEDNGQVMRWDGLAGTFLMQLVDTVTFSQQQSVSPPTTLMDQGIKSFVSDGNELFYVSEYYPKRFEHLSAESIKFREDVWSFKSGSNLQWAMEHLLNLVQYAVTHLNLNRPAVCAIPASSRYRTERRYSVILEDVAQKCGVINGYQLITNKVNRQPKHLGLGSFNVGQHVEIMPSVAGLDILLFDDVYTSGNTFHQMKDVLIAKGAKSVHGIFLARTVMMGN